MLLQIWTYLVSYGPFKRIFKDCQQSDEKQLRILKK